MQTFLPYPSFRLSAQCLDDKRLGKQRSETKILLNGGWPNHPASKMWRGYNLALAAYGYEICRAWQGRGFNDTLMEFFRERMDKTHKLPPWFGNPGFHASHRSNLLRKDFEFYSKYGWTEPDNLPYIWPSGEI